MSKHQTANAGRLILQPNGRWAIVNDELTSGDCIMLLKPGAGMIRAWLHGRIEHGQGEYYFLWEDTKGGPGMRIELREGMLAVRK